MHTYERAVAIEDCFFIIFERIKVDFPVVDETRLTLLIHHSTLLYIFHLAASHVFTT